MPMVTEEEKGEEYCFDVVLTICPLPVFLFIISHVLETISQVIILRLLSDFEHMLTYHVL